MAIYYVELNTTVVDGSQYTANDTIVIRAGNRGGLKFQNFNGNGNYITITNEKTTPSTQVEIDGISDRGCLSISNCKYIDLGGNNDAGLEYGIKVINDDTSQSKASVWVYGESDHIKISNLEITCEGGTSRLGIGIYVADDTLTSAWTFNTFEIHHNYIHDMRYSGIHAGQNDPGKYNIPYVGTFSIHDNLLENIGSYGITYKGVNEPNNYIYNNVIIKTGLIPGDLPVRALHGIGVQYTRTGIYIDIYNNWIEKTVGPGLKIDGNNHLIHNNTICGCGSSNDESWGNGIVVHPLSGITSDVELYDNIIIQPYRYGIRTLENCSNISYKRNLIGDAGIGEAYGTGLIAGTGADANIYHDNVADFGFNTWSNDGDYSNDDFTIGNFMDKLKVSPNGHYLETISGEPFMWMGIVPWKMPEMADRNDIDYFISQIKKSEHKYNVILSAIIMGRSCTTLNPPNAYGHQPFNGGDVPDFTNPRIVSGGSPDYPTDFWDHLDYLVRECEANGIYLVLLPQWSNTYVHNRYNCDITPMDAPTARSYGEFLGNRYKNKNNIIWMMGGSGGDPAERGTKDLYRAQAEGILKGYTGCITCPSWNQPSALWDELLMTYHGNISKFVGTRVSQLWGAEDVWIDIDGCNNCTSRRGDWYGVITDGYNLSPHKPMIEVEGQGFWDEYDPNWGPNFEGTKAFPYMHYLFGGAGPSNLDQHWNFEPGWEHNLNLPERDWVGHMTKFMEDVWHKLIPDNGMILSNPGTLWGEIVSARSSDNDLIMVSFSEEGSGTAQIDLSDLSSYPSVRGTWLNTSNGIIQDAGIHSPAATPWFTVPTTWDGAVLKVEGISYDPCEGVVCNNVCVGKDLWSQKCVDGSCVPNQLIESNSSTCEYDPCAGVVCESVCVGDDLWSQKCVDGSCVLNQLIGSNSSICGYDPCKGVVCDNVCVGDDLWSQRCDPATGNCVLNQLILQDSIYCTIPDQVPSDESTINTYLILGGFGVMGLAMLMLSKKR